MYGLNVIYQGVFGEKDDTTKTTFEALSSTRGWSQLVCFLNMIGNLVFSVAFEITIVALEWKMSPMDPLHVFQPGCFG